MSGMKSAVKISTRSPLRNRSLRRGVSWICIFCSAVCLAGRCGDLSLSNDHSELTFDKRGRIVSVKERESGRELLEKPAAFAVLRLSSGREVAAESMERRGDVLLLQIPFEGSFVSLRGESFGDGCTFRITDCRLPQDSRLFIGRMVPSPEKWLGKRANMASDEKSGLCVRPYDIFSSMMCAKRFLCVVIPSDRAAGAGFGIVAAPRRRLRKALQSMTLVSGRPYTLAGGPWALDSEETRGSYLNANVSVRNLDSVLAMVERGGFDVLHFRESWYALRGHYPVNTNNWPNGIADMKAAVAKIHAAGYRAGLHTLTACIDVKDPWVSGEENSQLYAQQSFTLAADLDADATELLVNERPSAEYDTVFTYSGRGNAIRIGGEIVQFTGVERDGKPYRFTGLRRGMFGTKRASHAKGAEAAYLQQRYVAFYPDPDKPLADKVADAIADVYNTCGFDMVYCDGTEGMRSDYGMAMMRDKIISRCAPNGRACINEDSASCRPQTWWYHSRVGAWDSCNWGPKQFHDMHVERIKKEQIRQADMLDVQMGWWTPYLFHRAFMFSAHTIDVMEYYASRNAGMDASMSIWSGDLAEKTVAFPLSRMMTVLGWYERARRARAFLPEVRESFDRKGAEFRFRQNERTGIWEVSDVQSCFYRATMPELSARSFDVTAAPECTALRVTALFAGEKPDAENSTVLTRGFAARDLVCATAHDKIRISVEDSRADDGSPAFRLTAENGGESPYGAWTKSSCVFSPYRAFKKNGRALRFRVKGDGSGALLNVQIESPREYGLALSEHYVTLDFRGWRDFDVPLRERDAERYGDYKWPDTGYAPVFHRWLKCDKISAVNFYLNEVPAKGKAVAEVSHITVVPDRELEMSDVRVALNGAEVKVPFEMTSGQFAELEGREWTLFTPNGDVLERRIGAAAPALSRGCNTVSVCGKCVDGSYPRTQVEVFAVGAPRKALVEFDTLSERARGYLAYEAVDPQIYAPSKGLDRLAPVTVRPGESAAVELSVFGPSPECEVVLGESRLAVPAVSRGDFVKVNFPGVYSGVNKVSVKLSPSDSDAAVRLEFVKRYQLKR